MRLPHITASFHGWDRVQKEEPGGFTLQTPGHPGKNTYKSGEYVIIAINKLLGRAAWNSNLP